jgi:hypothetical protein
VAYVSLNAAEGSAALDDMDDLGAPSGYLVDVLTEDDKTIQSQLAEASIIVIEHPASVDDLRSALVGAAVEGMKAAFERGAMVLAEGAATSLFGSWLVSEAEQLAAGLEWLENALIVPFMTSIAESEQARYVLETQPTAIAVGIGAGSALALGPDGEVETWGRRQVTVALGRSHKA